MSAYAESERADHVRLAILIQCWKNVTKSYSATAGANRTISAKQTCGIEASPQALRCPSDHLVPSGSPASEVASWLWCLAGPSAERNTPQVSGSDQQTAYRTRRDDPCAMTNRTSHLDLTWFPPLLTQIWKEWQRSEIRSRPPVWRMVLQDEMWGPAYKEKEWKRWNTSRFDMFPRQACATFSR